MAQSIPSVPIPSPRICHLIGVPAVGNLSQNFCPGVGHLSILLEAFNDVPFLIFHLKICLFR